jgi:hypothetical protein
MALSGRARLIGSLAAPLCNPFPLKKVMCTYECVTRTPDASFNSLLRKKKKVFKKFVRRVTDKVERRPASELRTNTRLFVA